MKAGQPSTRKDRSASFMDGTSGDSSTFSAEAFFETQEPPVKLAHLLDGVKTFVEGHAKAGRRVVLVTVRSFPPPIQAGLQQHT